MRRFFPLPFRCGQPKTHADSISAQKESAQSPTSPCCDTLNGSHQTWSGRHFFRPFSFGDITGSHWAVTAAALHWPLLNKRRWKRKKLPRIGLVAISRAPEQRETPLGHNKTTRNKNWRSFRPIEIFKLDKLSTLHNEKKSEEISRGIINIKNHTGQ